MSLGNYISTGTTAAYSTTVLQPSHEPGISNQLWKYVSPLIFLGGLSGNLLTLLVLRRADHYGRSTTTTSAAKVYLNTLAIADSGVLITGLLPEWLRQTNLFWLRELDPYACRAEKFLFYVTADVAIWILVIFTIDRCSAVLAPLRRADDKRRRRRAWLCCAGAILMAIAKNAHVFWTRGREYDVVTGEITKNCGQPSPYRHFEQYVRPWIAFASISLFPFVTIFVCNVLIVRALTCTRKKGQLQTGLNGYVHSVVKDKRYMQTTAMCLSVSFAFLVCIPTSIVLLIGKPYWVDKNGNSNNAYYVAKAVNNMLAYVNHSINFFLYCLSGQLFREELVAMLHGRPTRRQSAATLLSTWLHADALSRRRSTDPRHVANLVAGGCTLGSRPLVCVSPPKSKSAPSLSKLSPRESREKDIVYAVTDMVTHM